MQSIKFSYRYKKMPPHVEMLDTWIKDLTVMDYKDLTPEQVKEDTETVDGEFYPLPRTRLIVIMLWSNALPAPVNWQTMRRYTPEKWSYYWSLRGQQVKIEIDGETPRIARRK